MLPISPNNSPPTNITVTSQPPQFSPPADVPMKSLAAAGRFEVVKKHVCDVCNKRFYFACQLKKHQSVHSTLKPFACPLCDTRFKRKCSVPTHIRDVHKTVTSQSSPPADVGASSAGHISPDKVLLCLFFTRIHPYMPCMSLELAAG